MVKFMHHAVFAAIARAFSVYKTDAVPRSLGDACVSALTGDVTCDDVVQTFAEAKYHGSLESLDLTNNVCSGNCYASLKLWFTSVSTACAGKVLDTFGTPPTMAGGYMWEGFNETCVRDPRTKKYCNDIIDQFTVVQSMEEMPHDELCHVCFIRKLAMMQSSQYSAYDKVYQEQLQYVYSHCDMQGPTEILPPLIPQPVSPTPLCITGRIYTTKGGESCESIANGTNVAGSTLYMANQDILTRCSDLSPGVDLCLPLTCETFFVRPQDDCSSIEAETGLIQGQLRQYNSWLNADCSNLQSATNFYGKNICVSPQGGTFTVTKFPTNPTTNPDSGDGYTQNVIRPPAGAHVARGTTLNCGKWYVVQENDICSTICVSNRIDIHLFRAVNPSLSDGDCTSKLVRSSAVCVGPVYGWNLTATETKTSMESTTATAGGGQAFGPTAAGAH